MSTPQDQERLRRLRDRQLSSRDPQHKQRQLHGRIARKHNTTVQQILSANNIKSVKSLRVGQILKITPGRRWDGKSDD